MNRMIPLKFAFQAESAVPVYLQIERYFERMIRSGKLRPGERIPSARDLTRDWGINYKVVQKALQRLKQAGLVDREPKRGTFVKHAGEQAVIGILFGTSLAAESAHFHRALLESLISEIQGMPDRNWTYRVYDGLYGLHTDPAFRASTVCRNLIGDLRNYSFKGIVQVIDRSGLLKILRANVDLPLVRLAAPLKNDLPDVIQDMCEFGRASVELIAQKKLKKIVYFRTLMLPLSILKDVDGMERARKQYQLPPIEIEKVAYKATSGMEFERQVYEKTLHLIDRWQSRRNDGGWPDALVISDDVAARSVALALVRKKVEVPKRLLVITLANKGIDHHYGIPVVRYEFSPGDIARALLQVLWGKMTGEPVVPQPIKVAGQMVFP